VLEFNCRFGDPETQPILMRLNSDLIDLCEAALDDALEGAEIRWDSRVALGVVMAAEGYPDQYRRGDIITGLDAAAQLPGKVFHAGTSQQDTGVATAGGRVLCAVGLGSAMREAQRQAYDLVRAIHWDGMQYRRDVGDRAVVRELKGRAGS
jgi:phosphoribosylamine--glycine ligase